jgi:hypothetical protein
MNWRRIKWKEKESEGIENERIKASLELFKGDNYDKYL